MEAIERVWEDEVEEGWVLEDAMERQLQEMVVVLLHHDHDGANAPQRQHLCRCCEGRSTDRPTKEAKWVADVIPETTTRLSGGFAM